MTRSPVALASRGRAGKCQIKGMSSAFIQEPITNENIPRARARGKGRPEEEEKRTTEKYPIIKVQQQRTRWTTQDLRLRL